MPSYEYEDLVGGNSAAIRGEDIANGNEPGFDTPLDRAIRVLQALKAPAARPEVVVGNDLAASAAKPVVAPSPADTVNPLGPAPQPAPPQDFGPPTTGLSSSRFAADENRPPDPAHSVDQATQMVNDQVVRMGEARSRYMKAKDAAAASRATAQADALDDSVTEQGLLNTKHERTMEMLNARADAETAGKLHQLSMLAKQEPNPGRWWENQSGLGKALWALSLVFGAAHTALTPGAKNAALDMVRQEISNDVALQDARLKREMAIGELDYSTMKEKQLRNRSDAMGKYEREYSRLQALERAWQVRAVAPNDLDAQAGKMESQMWFEQMKLPLVQQLRSELVDARARAEQMRHQEGMQASAQRFQNDQRIATERYQSGEKELDRQLQRDLAEIKVSGKFATDSRGVPVDEHGVPLYRTVQSGAGTGLVLKAPGGKPGGIGGRGELNVRTDKQLEDANKVVRNANTGYTARVELLKLLKEEGAVETIAGIGAGIVNPRINAKVQELGYAIARSQNDRVSDKDFSSGVQQAMGFDANGNWLQRGKFAVSKDEIISMLEKDVADMPAKVTDSLQTYNDKGINGDSELVWDPKLLAAPKVEERTQEDIRGVTSVAVPGVSQYTVKSYDEASQKAVTEPERRTLPEHDPGPVQAIISMSRDDKGKTSMRSPDDVSAEASRVISKLDADIKRAHEAGDVAAERKLTNTRAIADSVANDVHKRAQETLDKFEQRVKATPYLSKDSARKQAREMGIRAPREVDAIIEKLKKY